MAFVDELLVVINERSPQPARVSELLGSMGDFPAYQGIENSDQVHFMEQDVMRVMSQACAHYRADIYNQVRQDIILLLLAHLKKHENHFYIAALFYCYDQFYQASKTNPQILEFANGASVFKKSIYEDRLSSSHFEKCVTTIPLNLINGFTVSMFNDDAACMIEGAKCSPISLASDVVNALKIGEDGCRSPYSAYAFSSYFFSGKEFFVERAMLLAPILKKELGSGDFLKLNLDPGALVRAIDIRFSYSRVVKSAFPGVDHSKSPESQQIECFKHYFSLLTDLGLVLDLNSQKTQEILGDVFIHCLQNRSDGFKYPLAVFMEMMNAFNVNLFSPCFFRDNSKLNVFEFFELACGYRNWGKDPQIVSFMDLIANYLVFSEEAAGQVYAYLKGLVDFIGHGKGGGENSCSIVVHNARDKKYIEPDQCARIIAAVFLNKTLSDPLRFVVLVLSFRNCTVVGVISRQLCEAMLEPVTENDKAHLEVMGARPADQSRVELKPGYLNVGFLLNVMTSEQHSKLTGELNSDAQVQSQSRLAWLIRLQLECGNLKGILESRTLRLPPSLFLNLSRETKKSIRFDDYGIALARSGLLLQDVIAEISTPLLSCYQLPGEVDEKNMMSFLDELKSIYKLTMVAVFEKLPDRLKNQISAKAIVESVYYFGEPTRFHDHALALTRVSALREHLTELQKAELSRLFFECYFNQSLGEFVYGDKSKSRPSADKNFEVYRCLGFDLNSEYKSVSLLEDERQQKSLAAGLILFQSSVLQKKDCDYHRPIFFSRIIAASLAGFNGADHSQAVPSRTDLNITTYEDAFIHWMIKREYGVFFLTEVSWAQFSWRDLFKDGLPFAWGNFLAELKKRFYYPSSQVDLSNFDASAMGLAQSSEMIDVIAANAIGLLVKQEGEYALRNGLTIASIKRAYVALLSQRPNLLQALRDKMFLNDTSCLLLHLLKTSDKKLELSETTKEFLEVFEKVKAGAVSQTVINQLYDSTKSQQPGVAPRAAILCLALKKDLSDEEFHGIVRQHLYHDFPLDYTPHNEVKSALRLLTKEAIEGLKRKLALFILEGGEEIKSRFRSESKNIETLKNNLLMHVIMAGKTTLDPKKTHVYTDVMTCLKNPLRIHSLFKQTTPDGVELGTWRFEEGARRSPT